MVIGHPTFCATTGIGALCTMVVTTWLPDKFTLPVLVEWTSLLNFEPYLKPGIRKSVWRANPLYATIIIIILCSVGDHSDPLPERDHDLGGSHCFVLHRWDLLCVDSFCHWWPEGCGAYLPYWWHRYWCLQTNVMQAEPMWTLMLKDNLLLTQFICMVLLNLH